MTQLGGDRRFWPIVIVFAVAMIGAWYGHLRLDEAQRLLDNAKGVAANDISLTRAARIELAADRQYLDDHQSSADAMRAAGFLRPQDRLELTEAVQALAMANRLNRIRVAVEPEQTRRDMPRASDAVVLVSTPVSISLEAASQADVFGFLEALPGLFTGVAIVESVQFRRAAGYEVIVSTQTDGDYRPTAMTAQIVLRWQTVRPTRESSSQTVVAQ